MKDHDVHGLNTQDKDAIASAAIASVSEQTFHPFETIIRRMQVYPAKIKTPATFNQAVFLGAPTNFAKTVTLMDGFWLAGFYKGLTRTYKFGGQPWVERQLEQQLNPYFSALSPANKKALMGATSGALLGLGEVLLFHPLDTVKIKRQNGDKTPLLKLVSQQKNSLYNGMGAAFARNIPGSFIMFGVRNELIGNFEKQNQGKPLAFWQHAAAAISGATAAVIFTNPQDMVKTRLQTLKTKVSAFSLFKKIIAEEGVAALAKGVPAKLFQAGPRFALPLLLTSYLPQIWHKQDQKEQPPKAFSNPKKPGP